MRVELLHRFITGTTTEAENRLLREWFRQSASREEFFQLFDTTWSDSPTEMPREVQERIFQRLSLELDGAWKGNMRAVAPRKHRMAKLRPWLREALKVAAIVALTLACGLYFHHSKKTEWQAVVNTITVPNGQRANVKLPDGTVVWLNAGTTLVYPAVFAEARREVKLEGEGYFEVSADKRHPFVVRTKRCDVEVLGTKFNVEAYADTDEFSTALMEGSVAVREHGKTSEAIRLSPHQEVRLKEKGLEVGPIADYDRFRWRDGLICFTDTPFPELMRRFEKCYGLSIVVENQRLDNYICSGKFRVADGLDNALRILRKNARFTFERNEDNTILYIR